MIERSKGKGFTLVELMVVIVVITILVTMTYFVVRSWRSDAAQTQVKNELINAANALNNTRNFTSSYPATADFSTVYKPGAEVTLSYSRRLAGTFCLNATSQKIPTIKWYIDSNVSMDPRPGSCTA